MKRTYLLFAVLFGGTIIGAHPSAADGALAVGLPAGGLTHGVVFGQLAGVSSADARTRAVKLCEGIEAAQTGFVPERASEAQKSCKVVQTFVDQCSAVALNGDAHNVATGIGWAVAADSSTANTKAIANCEAMAARGQHRACAVQAVRCDGTAK